MSLSFDDNYTIENWFCELQLYEKESTQYIELRNKIYNFIYVRLSDLLATKKVQWYKKYSLHAEDCDSIFNDALLSCVEKYKPKRVKFITYFWSACENLAKNYFKHYRRMRRIPPANLVNIGFSTIFSEKQSKSQHSSETTEDIFSYLKTLQDTEDSSFDLRLEIQEMLQLIKSRLSSTDTKIVEYLYDGYQTSQIRDFLSIDHKELSRRLRFIRNTAKKVFTRYE